MTDETELPKSENEVRTEWIAKFAAYMKDKTIPNFEALMKHANEFIAATECPLATNVLMREYQASKVT